jgi:GMP synthase (glutamine-hydrolysing)
MIELGISICRAALWTQSVSAKTAFLPPAGISIHWKRADRMDKILVLDFGGQYNQLIARRVRSEQVYAEIRHCDKITPPEIKKVGYRGIILTGGPNSVYEPSSPRYDPAVLELGIPVLGICYGFQLLAFLAGGEVATADSGSEYGSTTLYAKGSALFDGVPEESVCWMSHTDT